VSIHPTQSSGLRRALRLAALAPVVATGLTFVTANVVRAEEAPVVEVEAISAPVIDSVTARPGGLTVEFAPAEGTSPLAYIVTATLEDVVKAVEVVPGDVSKASLGGLVNGTEYDVTVTGITLLDFTDVSEVVTGTPLAEGANIIGPLAVQNLDVERTNISATATWDAPLSDGGSPIKGYVMNVVDQTTGKLVEWRNLAADVRSASVAPLVPGHVYDINVFAVSATLFGVLDTFDEVVGSAALANPEAPTVPWATAFADEDGNVIANWGAADEHGVPIAGYNVLLVQDGKMVDWAVAGPNARSGGVSGLEAEEDASVYVFSTSAIGFGELVEIELPAAD
jgi:hypothetical protein